MINHCIGEMKGRTSVYTLRAHRVIMLTVVLVVVAFGFGTVTIARVRFCANSGLRPPYVIRISSS